MPFYVTKIGKVVLSENIIKSIFCNLSLHVPHIFVNLDRNLKMFIDCQTDVIIDEHENESKQLYNK